MRIATIIAACTLSIATAHAEQAVQQTIQDRVTGAIATELGRCRIDVASSNATAEALNTALMQAQARIAELEKKLEGGGSP